MKLGQKNRARGRVLYFFDINEGGGFLGNKN
ncbi:hypothetical protein M272_14775 [Vibrio natriegens NBRC 15636 = ATCC 14048 = DSM 759]|nr:hypothetical protein M272_14775 [Vibrio natriegens NBRC 15636 = ATCC 14048 = DSM 759]